MEPMELDTGHLLVLFVKTDVMFDLTLVLYS